MRLQNKRIYIADDDEIVREAIATVLEDEGACVIQSPDGETAFTSVAFGTPDCVIMDLYMPRFDGFESIEAMNGLLALDCPIVVLTGHGTEENVSRVRNLGAALCLSKPLKADELVDAVVKSIDG